MILLFFPIKIEYGKETTPPWHLISLPHGTKAVYGLTSSIINLLERQNPTIMKEIGPQLEVFDQIVIVIFCIEIVLRIYAHGTRFFRDPWGIFDFIVVSITLTPSNDSLSATIVFP